MINRMDNICEAVIKGKWPANRRQFFDIPGLLPGYPGPVASESPLQRRGLAELSMVAAAQTSFSGSEDLTLSPQVNVSSKKKLLFKNAHSTDLVCTYWLT